MKLLLTFIVTLMLSFPAFAEADDEFTLKPDEHQNQALNMVKIYFQAKAVERNFEFIKEQLEGQEALYSTVNLFGEKVDKLMTKTEDGVKNVIDGKSLLARIVVSGTPALMIRFYSKTFKFKLSQAGLLSEEITVALDEMVASVKNISSLVTASTPSGGNLDGRPSN